MVFYKVAKWCCGQISWKVPLSSWIWYESSYFSTILIEKSRTPIFGTPYTGCCIPYLVDKLDKDQYIIKGFIFVQIHFLAAVKTARLSLIGLHPFGVALPVWFSWSPAAFFAHPPTLSFELFASLVTVRATMYSHSLSISRDFFLRFWSSLFWILLSEFKRLTASVDFIICGLPEDITGAEKRKNHLVNWFWTSGPIMLKPSR